MIIGIIGIGDRIDFTTKEGKRIAGSNLYVAYEDENTKGLKCEKIFINESIAIPRDLKPNDKVDLIFNSRGKVLEIKKVNV